MAADSNDSDQEHFDGDFKTKFNKDMLAMLSQGSSNDVRIILSDGEITANKDVLAARCEYFAANLRWKEETKDDSGYIEITDCSKEVMQRIIQYLFTGSIKFKDLNLLQQLELVNQVRKLLLGDDVQSMIDTHLKENVLSYRALGKFLSVSKHTLCINTIKALEYVNNYCIEDLKENIIKNIIVLFTSISQDEEASFTFSTLSVQTLKDLFFYIRPIQEKHPIKRKTRKLNSSRFRCLLAWYKRNKNWSQEDKEDILGTFDLDLFSGTDLFQLVKPSGLFPDDEVDKRILKVLEESEKKDFLEELNFANFD